MKTLNKNANGYKYKYTDLSEIHGYLESEGLSYYQYVDVVDGNDYIMTVKIDADGKESKPIRGCRVVQAILEKNDNPAQRQGSALTYARRYSLLLAYGLCTTDDDAEMLSDRDEMHQKISENHLDILEAKAKAVGVPMQAILDRYGKESAEDLTEGDYGLALNALNRTKKQTEKMQK